MELQSADGSESRFEAYVEGLVSVIGHADRAGPMRDYCLGLVMPCERKSVEPIAAITSPERTAAQHQSLLHFVGQSPSSDQKVLAKVGEMVLLAIERHGPIEAWIVDDTGHPKKGSTERQEYPPEPSVLQNLFLFERSALLPSHAMWFRAIDRPFDTWLVTFRRPPSYSVM